MTFSELRAGVGAAQIETGLRLIFFYDFVTRIGRYLIFILVVVRVLPNALDLLLIHRLI